MASIIPQPAAAVTKPFELSSKLPPQKKGKNICRIRLVRSNGETAGFISRKQATKEYGGCYLVTDDPREALRVHVRSASFPGQPERLALGLVDEERGSWLATLDTTEGTIVGGVLVTAIVPEPIDKTQQTVFRTSYTLYPKVPASDFTCRSWTVSKNGKLEALGFIWLVGDPPSGERILCFWSHKVWGEEQDQNIVELALDHI